MNRAVSSRLSKLEAKTSREGIVHVIPAASDEEYRTRRDTLIRDGAHVEDVFIRIMSFREEEPFSTGKTAGELFDDIAKRGWRVGGPGKRQLHTDQACEPEAHLGVR